MSRINLEGSRLDDVVLGTKLKALFVSQTLGAAYTIDADAPVVHIFDPGGAGRVITLPAEASSRGLMFIIINSADAAEALDVQDDGTTTVATIAQSEMAVLFCDGTTWFSLVGTNT